MNSTTKLIVGIIVVLIIGFILYLSLSYEEEYFNKVTLPEDIPYVNKTDMTYIDTIIKVGLNELDIKPTSVIIRKMDGMLRPQIQNGLQTEAYVLGNDKNQYLVVVSSMSRKKALTIISHELIHIKQLYDGRMKFLEHGSLLWEGKKYNNENLPDYFQREWEQEAESDGKSLKNKIEQILLE